MVTGLAASPPIFERAYVISDLHIGGDTNQQMFGSGRQFTVFTKRVIELINGLRKKKKKARVVLVINGDFVDFLAEPRAAEFNLEHAPDMLENIFKRPSFVPVLKGLQAFIETPGAHLVITLGNHDIELALPDTRRTLVQLLTKNRPELEGQIELCFDGWGYRFQVGGKRAICLHGNEADGYNFTRYDELDRVVHDLHLFGHSEFGADWCPSAGSRFVVQAINPIKNRFPFIDLLKPEFPLAVTILGLLDPTKIRFADDAARLKATALYNEQLRPTSQRRMLSTDTGLTATVGVGHFRGSVVTDSEIEERAEHALAMGTIDELICMPPEDEMLGMTQWLTSLREAVRNVRDQSVDLTHRFVSELTGTAREVHCRAVQAAIRPLVTNIAHDVTSMGEMDKLIEKNTRADYDVVFAGHTHFRRLTMRSTGQGRYVNTGTWANLIGLTRSQVDSAEFESIYDALRAGNRDALLDADLVRQECTVAEMAIERNRQVVVSLGEVTEKAFEPQAVKSVSI